MWRSGDLAISSAQSRARPMLRTLNPLMALLCSSQLLHRHKDRRDVPIWFVILNDAVAVGVVLHAERQIADPCHRLLRFTSRRGNHKVRTTVGQNSTQTGVLDSGHRPNQFNESVPSRIFGAILTEHAMDVVVLV